MRGPGDPEPDASETIRLPRRDLDPAETLRLSSRAHEREGGDSAEPFPDGETREALAISSWDVSAEGDASTVSLSGSAPPNSKVELTDWTLPVGVTTADARGRWALTLASVGDGTHMYRVRATDALGAALGTSALQTVTIGVEEQEPEPEYVSRGRRPALALVAVAALLVLGGLAALLLRAQGGHHAASRSSTPQTRPGTGVTATSLPLRKHATPKVVALKATPRNTQAPRIVAPVPTSTPTATSTPRPVRPTATPTARPTPTRVKPSRVVTGRAKPTRTAPRKAARPTPRRTVPPKPTPTRAAPRTVPRPTGPPPTPTPPQPARSWSFAALPQTSGQVILTLSNQNAVTVDVYIGTASRLQHVRVPAAGGVEMQLSSHDAAQALTITASAPILPSRLVIRHQSVQVSYGTPGKP